VAAALIETLVLMGVTYGLVSAFVTLHFHWTPAALVPVAFLILTGIGYSLIIAGLTLLWKRIQLLQETMLLLIMVFAISALPVLTVPGWFTGIGRAFPVTSAVASLYGVMLGHRGVTGGVGNRRPGLGRRHRRRLPGRGPRRFSRAGTRHQGPRRPGRLLTDHVRTHNMTSIEHDDDAGLAGFLAGYRPGAGDADTVPITVTYAVIGLTNFGEQLVPSTRLAEILGRPVGEAEALARRWAWPGTQVADGLITVNL
jgi:hypothetical protein